jgi:hypothetical protein
MELRTTSPNVAYDAAQLRDLLAAEQSPKVADEDEHGGMFAPQRLEPDALPLWAGDLDGP